MKTRNQGAAFFLLAGSMLATASPASAQTLLIQGSGASFPFPIYAKWFKAYTDENPTVRFSYQTVGSISGQKHLLAGDVDFAGSDLPMSDSDLATARDRILHIPTVGNIVVVAYNLPAKPKLRFDGTTIADIYLGKITMWNDPRISDLNPNIKLPDLEITVIRLADGGGATSIFTSYLSEQSPIWKNVVGTNNPEDWPVGAPPKGSGSPVATVQDKVGAICYTELVYARIHELPVADLKNAEGNFITPSPDSGSAALENARIADHLRLPLVNDSGANAYPMTGCTYLLVYENLKEHTTPSSKAGRFVDFLNWAVTDGQKMAAPLGYAPLPANLQKRVLSKIEEIRR